MARYLVTGAAGFIASRVVELLCAEGHEVFGIDNLNDAYDVRLKEWRLQRLINLPSFKFAKIDICAQDSLSQFWKTYYPFDAVINLAARAGVRQSAENPWVYLQTNATGTLNLLELCREHNVRKFVLASTSSLYGKHNPMPFREDADTNRPLSSYAASKKAAETLCYTYHHTYGIDVTVFRYFTVYGPAGRPDMSIFRFIQWIREGREVCIFGDGTQSRDFTYVDDIARGTIAGLKPVGYEIINLGSDRPVVLLDVIRQIERHFNCQANLVYGPQHIADVPATWADISKARNLLEWSSRVVHEAGIANALEWYELNRSWAHCVATD